MIRISVCALAFAAVGCGKSYCERLEATVEDCGEGTDNELGIEACEEMVADCDRGDRKLLKESLECSADAGLFDCSPTGTTTATDGFDDLGALLACYAPLIALSEACATSVGATSTTTTTY